MKPKSVSVSRVIPATPQALFSVVSDSSFHHVIDGSGSVKGTSGVSEPLRLGTRFNMKMKMGLPYVIGNTVVEFEEDELIAWNHVGGHRWRYEFEALEPVDGEAQTRVIETFDWSTAKATFYIELMGWPKRHLPNMERTLELLEAFVCNRIGTHEES